MSQAVIDAIRVLRIELGIANDRVAQHAELQPRDLDILDVIDRDGPCTPSFLATRTGISPATLTGILARLEKKNWIRRETSPSDGRSVQLTSTERFAELRALYRAGDSTVKKLTASFSAAEQQTILDFLTRAAEVVRETGEQLAAPQTPD